MTASAAGPIVAFGGGLLSFLSPCVLPLVPSYLGFLSGMTLDEMGSNRHRAVAHALLFVAGFSLVFIALGAGATALGASLRFHKIALARAGGVVVIIFGLYTIGLLRFSWFDRERRVHLEDKPVGYLGSMLVGMAFAAGWTPCIGPILGGILVLAGTSGDVAHGVVLLTAYSAGLAMPFLVAAFALDAFRETLRRFSGWMPWVQRVSGAVLIAVGILLVTGDFTRLAAWLQGLTPEFLRKSL
ncbi:MAG TPA: cytochrome c biogenesis protein CcdA [Gemmatimonadales bacterium]|jgi:cytochrome c-type biogenesis protein